MPPDKRLVKLNSRIAQAFKDIEKVTDAHVGEFAGDIAKMAKQMMRDKLKRSKKTTGELVARTRAEKKGKSWSVTTNATNNQGYGYGAAQEWGWRMKRKGKKKKGRMTIVRATFGMIARWKRGERWRD